MKRYIGIIVKNQWEEILLYDHSFYIKVPVNENDEVDKIIKKEIYDVLNKDFFKINKVYDEKIKHWESEVTMYVVEVPIYTKDFDFINIKYLENEILNFEDKSFFKKNILKQEELTTLINTVFNFIYLIFAVEVISRIENMISLEIFLIFISGFILMSVVTNKYIKPKVEGYITKLKYDIKVYNFLIRLLIVFYCIKTILYTAPK